MLNNMISISNGLYRHVIVAIIFVILGAFLLLFSLSGFYLLLPFALLLILVGLCFTGFDFNPETKMYRKYYKVLGIKIGKWVSYEEYCFIMYHGVMLSRAIETRPYSKNTVSQVNNASDTFDYNYNTYKLFLLNKTHTKKYFLKYIDDLDKVKATAQYLSDNLKMDIVKYNPPTTQSRLRRTK